MQFFTSIQVLVLVLIPFNPLSTIATLVTWRGLTSWNLFSKYLKNVRKLGLFSLCFLWLPRIPFFCLWVFTLEATPAVCGNLTDISQPKHRICKIDMWKWLMGFFETNDASIASSSLFQQQHSMRRTGNTNFGLHYLLWFSVQEGSLSHKIAKFHTPQYISPRYHECQT